MKKIFLACAAAVAFIACASQNQVDLTGTWAIENAMGVSTENAMNHAFINFDADGRMNGNASVNVFSGEYSVKGSELRFENIGMTRMMGSSMEIEDAITAALNTVASVVVDGDKVTFLNENAETVMIAVKEK